MSGLQVIQERIFDISSRSVSELIVVARDALERAASFDEVRTIRDKAEAFRAYQRSIGGARDMIDVGTEVKIRAERRMGEELAKAELQAGARGIGSNQYEVKSRPVTSPSLSDIGVTKMQSSRYQHLAAIPEDDFETAIEAHKAVGEPISTASVARTANALNALPEAAKQELVARGEAEILEAAKRIKAENAHNHRAQGSGENEWYTPAQYVEAARTVLGSIDLDPASSEFANRTVCAAQFYSIDDDGLEKPWSGSVWLNPPYAQPWIMRFMQKLVDGARGGAIDRAIALTHNYTDTAWFHVAADASSAICFTRGRIGFLSPDGQRAAPTQGQAFFYFGNDVAKFTQTFSQFGLIVIKQPC